MKAMFFYIKKKIKSFLPQTLLARFMLIIIVPVLLGQYASIHMFYNRHWYKVMANTSTILASEIAMFTSQWQQGEILHDSGKFLNLRFKLIQKPEAKQVHTNEYQEEVAIFSNILRTRIKQDFNIYFTEKNASIDIKVQDGILRISLPNKSLINPSTDIFVLWILSLSALLLVVSLIFSKNQIKSILELASALDNYGKGNILHYKPNGAKEIKLAGLSFLKMRERLERQYAKRTQMLAMISHDLKTPLTRMLLQTELMEDALVAKDFQEDIINMQKIIESYLDFARGEGGEQWQKIEINHWCQQLANNRHFAALNIKLYQHVEELYAKIKPVAFARAINNILENSLKYATRLDIKIYQNDDERIILEFIDDGPGIIDDQKKYALKPFYRIDQSRSNPSGGVGLGLAIAREVVKGHNGNILLLDNTKEHGLIVKIQLPIYKDET